MKLGGKIYLTVKNEYAGQRLDTALAQLIPELSRSGVANLIRNNCITVESFEVKPSYRLKGGERIEIILNQVPGPVDVKAQPIELSVLHEDRDIIVLNKKAGMVVHPAPGNYEDTLVNALVHRIPEIHTIGDTLRPGIVHRLDKDTSGVMVVAKTQLALNHLAQQFQNRSLRKKYLALVWGVPKEREGEVIAPIGRHPTDRKKMSVHSHKGRNAVTLWQLKEEYADISLLEIEIKTGRTHQIRVHCASIHHPVVGDLIYSNGKNIRQIMEKEQSELLVKRQMLHAWKLSIIHPRTLLQMTFTAPMPQDMHTLIEFLKQRKVTQNFEGK